MHEIDSYLIAPGSTVTSAAEINNEALNVDESAILIDPPVPWMGSTCENGKTKGLGISPSAFSGIWEVVGGSGCGEMSQFNFP